MGKVKKEKKVKPLHINGDELSLDDKSKILDVDLKVLQVQEKKALVEGKFDEVKVTNEVDKLTIDKINCLKHLMVTDYVDEEQQLFSEKYQFRQAFDEIDKGIIKQKIFELIKRL
jgi:hypothetical protein